MSWLQVVLIQVVDGSARNSVLNCRFHEMFLFKRVSRNLNYDLFFLSVH
jgi:hypothetical protein